MKLYPIKTIGNTIKEVEARIFSYVIQGETFEFLVHESLSRVGELVVTHKDSGSGVCVIPAITKKFLANEEVLLEAQVALEASIEKHGAARMRSVLAGAKPI